MVLRSYSNNCDDSRVYMQVCFYKIKQPTQKWVYKDES